MPGVPSSIVEPIWDQFAALIPPRPDNHPFGAHRPRVDDRMVFGKLVQVLVFGIAYAKASDQTCSAATIRRRRDEWIWAGLFADLGQLCLDGFDRMIGLDLSRLVVGGCVVKAPRGGEAAGKSPADRGKQGTRRSPLTDGTGLPPGVVVAPANRPGSPLLYPTLETLGRFGFNLPERITVQLDAGHDSGKTRDLLAMPGREGRISAKGTPPQADARWVVERANSWHNPGFKQLLACTEVRTRVIEAHIALANAIILIHQPIHRAWTTWRWDTRPNRKP
ncbi:MAG: IS5 family transposase [Bifidobacteriaceae bacterium]|jgi:transposase|nr:IS5 family transposase [Bifidobacteriaceae bacterium]